MSLEPQREPCGSSCDEIRYDRNRYFTGKYMTARDFCDEQAFFLSRQRLHHRLLHGWGVVCGLGVTYHPDPACSGHWVIVHSGAALDCCGREILFEQDLTYQLPLPHKNTDGTVIEDPLAIDEPFLLCVEYGEQLIEEAPSLYTEGGCDPTRKEANRIRETAKLSVVRLNDASVKSGCWHLPSTYEADSHPPADPPPPTYAAGRHPLPFKDDCRDGAPGPGGTCLTPECICGNRVPIALIDPKKTVERTEKYGENDVKRTYPFSIDTQGRRALVVPAQYMTHIVGINWPHGGVVKLSDLRARNGQLIVTFDRNIQPADGNGTGINDYTFLVQAGRPGRNLEFVPFHPEHRPQLHHDRHAIFTIAHHAMNPEDGDSIVGKTVYITLKCDFIMDCHGNPVDGTHLRGRRPTGDGTMGGDFCSWFRVVHGDGAGTYGDRP